MCYSKNISIYSFTTSILTNLFLIYYSSIIKNKQYSLNIKIIGYGMMFVGVMQLFDYIFWTNQKENKTNFITTKLAMVFNHLQPIIFALLFLLFKGKLGQMSSIVIILYLVFALIYSIKSWDNIDYTLVREKSKPGLYWQWNYQPSSFYFYTMFLLTLTILFYENMSFPLNIICIAISNLTFFYSLIKYTNKGETGRMWCYFASFSSLLVLLKQTK